MGLNHQLDGRNRSKYIVKNIELFKRSIQNPNDPFGPANQAKARPNMMKSPATAAHCLDWVHQP